MVAFCALSVLTMNRDKDFNSLNQYTTDELFQLLKTQGQFPFGGPELKKALGFKNIVFPGEGGFCNLVSISKNTITMAQQKKKGTGLFKSLAIDAVTDGTGSLFNIEGHGNAGLMQSIAMEIERLA